MRIDDFEQWLRDARRRPLVMGVLNVTPDSFSDGGQYLDPAAAMAHARAMILQGADVIDVGGESTRPGSMPVAVEEQIRRVVPVVRAVREGWEGVISVDTTWAAVAEAALDVGATLINDISAGQNDPHLLPLVAKRQVGVILMHMRGTPATMQNEPRYADVVGEVGEFLCKRRAAAEGAGVVPARILLDPGIGFGKNVEHNLQLLGRLDELVVLGSPVVVGTSRKRFIGAITGESEPAGRVWGTAATVAWSIANGAAMVRVHDVEPMVQVVQMIQAICRYAPEE